MLLAALADGSPAGSERAAAEALVDGCGLCAATIADLVALRSATRSMPTPPRPRDYQLTPADAARLRPAGWRRWVAAFGVATRPRQPAAGDRPDDARPGRAARRGRAVAHAGRGDQLRSTRDRRSRPPEPASRPIAAPELASGAPRARDGRRTRVSAAPGVPAVRSDRPRPSPTAASPTPQPVTGGTQNGGPIRPATRSAAASSRLARAPRGRGGPDRYVSPTETDGLLNAGTEAGLPSLVTLSGVVLLLGLALFGLRWAAHRFGD